MDVLSLFGNIHLISQRYILTNIDNKINILTDKGIYKPVFPAADLPDSLITFVHDDIMGTKYSKDSRFRSTQC